MCYATCAARVPCYDWSPRGHQLLRMLMAGGAGCARCKKPARMQVISVCSELETSSLSFADGWECRLCQVYRACKNAGDLCIFRYHHSVDGELTRVGRSPRAKSFFVIIGRSGK